MSSSNNVISSYGEQPDRRNSEGGFKTLLLLTVLTVVFIACFGCGMDFTTATIGGYEHEDLSSSRYKELVLKAAGTLADSKRPEDWSTAAKYYGSVKMFDEMDECIAKYVEKEPELGLTLICVGEKINKFYGRKAQ